MPKETEEIVVFFRSPESVQIVGKREHTLPDSLVCGANDACEKSRAS